MGANAVDVNAPLPEGAERRPLRRYHYVSLTVEADADVVAEAANRKARQGYYLVTATPVPRRDGRADVLLTFARRLRRVRERAVVPTAPPAAPEVQP